MASSNLNLLHLRWPSCRVVQCYARYKFQRSGMFYLLGKSLNFRLSSIPANQKNLFRTDPKLLALKKSSGSREDV